MTLYDWFVNFTVDLGALGASMGNVFLEILLNLGFNKIFEVFAKDGVENYAYNWYLWYKG